MFYTTIIQIYTRYLRVEQITLAYTIKEIEKLIESNSGDTGRLQHIADFLNKEKPLYKTDKAYLEKKLNSTITISPKKIIPKEDTSITQIKELIKKGKGDPGRLQHIIDTIQNERPTYLSDKLYLENNFKIKITQKLKKDIETGRKTKLKVEDERKERAVMPKDWKPIDTNLKIEKISEKLKTEEEKIEIQNNDSKDMGLQKSKLEQLTLARKNNEEKLKKERQLLEDKINDEKTLIQKQTKLSEDVDLQKEELLKVKEEKTKILKKIDSQKEVISKELAMQKKQLVQAQIEQDKIESQVDNEKTILSKMAQEQKTRLMKQAKMAQQIKEKQAELEKTKQDYEQIISQVNDERKEIKESEKLKEEIKTMEKDLNKSVKDRLKISKTIIKEKNKIAIKVKQEKEKSKQQEIVKKQIMKEEKVFEALQKKRKRIDQSIKEKNQKLKPVSYTHLTLPTKA